LEGQGIDERMILIWIFRKENWEHGLDFGGSGVGRAVVSCKSGDENYGSIKRGVFLD